MKKTFKKLISVVLVVLMVFSLATPAFAAEDTVSTQIAVVRPTIKIDKLIYEENEEVKITVETANFGNEDADVVLQFETTPFISMDEKTDNIGLIAAKDKITTSYTAVTKEMNSFGIAGVMKAIKIVFGCVLPVLCKFFTLFMNNIDCQVVVIGDVTAAIIAKAVLQNDKTETPDEPEKGTCTVTFDLNYPGAPAAETQKVKAGENAVFTEIPERTNYAFVGWYTSEDFAETFKFSTVISEDITLFARWVNTADTTDSDADGLPDAIEEYLGTDINKTDTDDDKLSDYIEVTILSYDPLNADSDNNSVNDCDEDYDSDSLTNIEEVQLGTSLTVKDTDGDDLEDNQELEIGTAPLIEDTDEDGVSDGKEIELGTDPLVSQLTFTVSITAEDNDDSVTPSVEIELEGSQVESLSIEEYDNDTFFPETMPGYLGQAYDFSVSGSFDSAVMSFEFDPSMLSEDSEPTIYYFNEDTQDLEPLPTTIEGNVASTEVTHFSKYILIDRAVFDSAFTWVDVWHSDISYTDVEIVFVIDDSGSMDWNDPSYERLNVARTLIDNLPANSKIGLVRFDGNYPLTSALTKTLTTDKEVVKNYLTRSYFYSPGGTDMYNGIQHAFPLYESTEATTLKMMIVLSDGETDDTYLHSSVIETANASDIRIYTVGLGDSTWYFNSYLQPLATNTGAAFYLADDADQLSEIYKDINEKIDIETDSDKDGIPDYYEDNMIIFSGVTVELDKNNPDTDGDGISDGEEVELEYIYSADRSMVCVIGKILSDPIEKDSDGDGILDKDDKNPNIWDVSDRDLAMFAALTYETPTDYNNKTIDDNYYFLNYASANEVYDYWNIVDCSGEKWADIATHFYATTYKNGNNIVIAYRGTDGEIGEWINNLVGVGAFNFHSEEGYAKNYAKRIANLYPNCNIYITGHSLGGYLAQFGAYQILENHNATKLKKVVYFNGIGLKYNKLLFWTKNDIIESLEKYYNGKNLISYNIYGDVVSALGTHSGSIISYFATTDAINQHRSKGGSSFVDFLSKSASGWLTVISDANIAYYYKYYNCTSISEYFWITHETDSFFYYLTSGTRNYR